MALTMIEIPQTDYEYSDSQKDTLEDLARRVAQLRDRGALSPTVLEHIRKYFRIKDIYNSNAIEGNLLSIGETRMVVEEGLTLTGRSLRDQAEAKNLASALDLFDTLAANAETPITGSDIRQMHSLVLQGLDNANAGKYREMEVKIGGSRFRPPSVEQIHPMMNDFTAWLGGASVPGADFAKVDGIVRAGAAHAWFVYIHPFVDGNGRVARLLMNLMLMRYGYPIAIIGKEDRARYYDALEQSQAADLSSFIGLVAESVGESLDEWEAAAAEQREREEWVNSIAGSFTNAVRQKVSNEYEVWKSAQELMSSYFRQTASLLDEQAGALGKVFFKEFGTLDFEKYVLMRHGDSAKKTWFFRIDLRTGERAARYLFFFGYPSLSWRGKIAVTAHLAREEPPGSYHYERLDNLSAFDVPDLREVGYLADRERFVARYANGVTKEGRIEEIGKQFIQQLVKREF